MAVSPTSEIFADYNITTSWRSRELAPRRLLVVFGHPDDESFGPGGTLAKYAAEGVTVHYACATKGECGDIDPKFLAGYSSAAELRTAELEAAATALGFSAVHYLGYRDSGMPGAPDNAHPQAYLNVPDEIATGQITALIRWLQPQVVLTFGPYGGYGHPDHIKSCQATTAAFSAAADPQAYPEQLDAGLEVWQPQKLYYTTFPTRFLKVATYAARLLGRNPRKLGTNKDVDLVAAATQATPISTRIKTAKYIKRKDAAWKAHASQLGSMGGLTVIPGEIRGLLSGTDTFTRAQPAWQPGTKIEYDFFHDL